MSRHFITKKVLLVRLSFFISEESFTDRSELIDIDGIVPES